MAVQPRSAIDVLLNLVPDSPSAVLTHLSNQPALASAQDSHGYSLVHAAASYGHLDLLRSLVQTYDASPNIVDEDNETPLFTAETPEVAKCLLELGADKEWKNAEGLTAEDKIEGEAEFPLVAAFLRLHATTSEAEASATNGASNGEGDAALGHPPPLPNGVKIDIGTMAETETEEGAPDPEIRRRIEELAAREDFQTEEGQEELKKLVTEIVGGMRQEGNEREVRRRIE